MRVVSRSGLITIALAIGAIAAPSAQAFRYYAPPASTPSVQAKVTVQPARNTTPVVGKTQQWICKIRSPRSEPVFCLSASTLAASTTNQGTFRVDDAAIGAGVVAGLALLGIGGTLAVRRRGELIHP
jgi:hypothetical protein